MDRHKFFYLGTNDLLCFTNTFPHIVGKMISDDPLMQYCFPINCREQPNTSGNCQSLVLSHYKYIMNKHLKDLHSAWSWQPIINPGYNSRCHRVSVKNNFRENKCSFKQIQTSPVNDFRKSASSLIINGKDQWKGHWIQSWRALILVLILLLPISSDAE